MAMVDPFSTDGDEVSASINVTPFVDVVLVLLVIFMVTTDFITPSAIEVTLPRAAHGGALVPQTLNLVIARDGRMSLDGQPVDRSTLELRLRQATSRAKPPQVVIAADREVDYGRVIGLIDLVKAHGIDDFALQIDRG
jgi:biopolymer transport protein ExbD